MPVSKKMIEAIWRSRDTTNKHLCVLEKDTALLQAAVNAAWTKFDQDDESTWPKNIDPSDVFEWLVLQRDNTGEPSLSFASFYNHNFYIEIYAHNGNDPYQISGVTHYANPNDLLHVPTQEDLK